MHEQPLLRQPHQPLRAPTATPSALAASTTASAAPG